jgi:Spy/CpxP family protein refolding chaperone
LVVLLAGGLLAPLLVVGCTQYRTPEERAEAFIEHVTWELELNEKQQANAQRVADVVLELRSALRGEDGARHTALQDLLTAETFDAGQAQSLYEQSRQETDQYIPKLIHAYSVFHAGLTSEQRQELSERLTRMHDHHHH